MLKDLLAKIEGKRSYIASVLTLIIVALYSFEIIDIDTFMKIVAFLGGVGLWTLRSAVAGK